MRTKMFQFAGNAGGSNEQLGKHFSHQSDVTCSQMYSSIDYVCSCVQGMVPPMLLPWSGPPTEQQFRDFWGPRGACEHFSDGGSGR
jgi:hypothetical protein